MSDTTLEIFHTPKGMTLADYLNKLERRVEALEKANKELERAAENAKRKLRDLKTSF